MKQKSPSDKTNLSNRQILAFKHNWLVEDGNTSSYQDGLYEVNGMLLVVVGKDVLNPDGDVIIKGNLSTFQVEGGLKAAIIEFISGIHLMIPSILSAETIKGGGDTSRQILFFKHDFDCYSLRMGLYETGWQIVGIITKDVINSEGEVIQKDDDPHTRIFPDLKTGIVDFIESITMNTEQSLIAEGLMNDSSLQQRQIN
jgi:hypothetical protein